MRIKRKLFRIKLVRKLVKLLRQGTSPHKMALSITMGLLLGVIPTFGFVAPMCAAFALWLRLNVPLALSTLYLMQPIHLILFVPFLRMGESIFDLPALPFSPKKLIHMIRTDWWNTLEFIGINNLAAIGAWLIVSVPASFLLYGLVLLLLKRFKKEQRDEKVAH